MTLREKVELWRENAIMRKSHEEADEYKTILYALDLAEAVKWIEEKGAWARSHDGMGAHKRGWSVRGERIQSPALWAPRATRDCFAPTLPEAVSALKTALEGQKRDA